MIRWSNRGGWPREGGTRAPRGPEKSSECEEEQEGLGQLLGGERRVQERGHGEGQNLQRLGNSNEKACCGPRLPNASELNHLLWGLCQTPDRLSEPSLLHSNSAEQWTLVPKRSCPLPWHHLKSLLQEPSYTAGNVDCQQPVGRTVWGSLKTKNRATIWPCNLTPTHVSGKKNHHSERCMQPYVHCSTIYSNQDVAI